MPIFDVDKARTCLFVKRSLGAGDRDTILVEIAVAMEPVDPKVEGRKS
ncbi:hypothetical protein MESS2_p20004 [Mesorhizobium metallidurans STM 2683]|uniref:Uncharacterized protein n=1 Tax=Mesorhizobium metallidurans STM 2683 TaxID=1297569 RepID=M5EZZ4_9HYPH|nr:hypothetical protein [Mesorhizobium metallidurans]CCV09500.1 hypothetical protein MESS2_p20004 [Mesorhizobium metallidurans STM 2683]